VGADLSGTTEELLFEVLRDVLDQLISKLELWATSEGSAIEELDAFIQNFVEHVIENRDAVRIFFQDFGSLSDKRRKEIARDRDSYDHFLIELLREAQEEGSIERDVDLKVASYAIFGMMNWIYQWYRPTKSSTPAQISKTMANLAIHGLATDRSTVESARPTT
jgi:AcrR family transcriptional regulator